MPDTMPQTSFSAKRKKAPPPARVANKENRTREYLTEPEVKRLINAAGSYGAYPLRDGTLVLMMFRHGFRVSEAVALRWEQVDLEGGFLHVTRRKNGTATRHPLAGREMRQLGKLRRENAELQSPYVFVSKRRDALSPRSVHVIVKRAGVEAGLEISTHPHMLRHSCGYYLASKGIDTRAIQDYLGHKNINHTVIYTQLTPDRFKNFWND